MMCNNFMNNDNHIELDCILNLGNLTTESPVKYFFENRQEDNWDEAPAEAEEIAQNNKIIDLFQEMRTPLTANIIALANGIVETDNDSKPIPENTPELPVTNVVPSVFTEWGYRRLCNQCIATIQNVQESLQLTSELQLMCLQIFEIIFPIIKLIKAVIMTKINESMAETYFVHSYSCLVSIMVSVLIFVTLLTLFL